MFVSDTTTAASGDLSKAGTAKEKLDADLNRFLNLLVTQLKNQDPLDPMDANEFTSQLVQFASVEQQIYQNANLEKMLTIQQTNQVATMVDFIGNTIEAVGDEVPLENGVAKTTYILEPAAGQLPIADKINITVQNAAGLTVFNAVGDVTPGQHEFTWDGQSNNDIAQDPGLYTVIVTAQDRAGDLIDVKQTVFGRVTGAGAENGAVQLYMGDVITSLEKVLSISETKAAAAAAP